MAYGFNDDKSKDDLYEVVYQHTYGTAENPTWGEALTAVHQAAYPWDYNKTYRLTVVSKYLSGGTRVNFKHIYNQTFAEIGHETGNADTVSLSSGFIDDSFELEWENISFARTSNYITANSFEVTFVDNVGNSVTKRSFLNSKIKQSAPQLQEVIVTLYAYEN